MIGQKWKEKVVGIYIWYYVYIKTSSKVISKKLYTIEKEHF